MQEKCSLCFRPGTKRNPINTHHIRGRKKGVHMPTMRVHSRNCHKFCDWVTSHYLLHGWGDELSEAMLVEVYQRTVTLQRDGKFIFKLFE